MRASARADRRQELQAQLDDALRLLDDWHVLGALEPGLSVERAAAAPLRRIGRAVAEAPWQAGRWRPWISGLAVWLATLPPALRRRALRRFAVRGEQARRITEFPKARDAWLRGLTRARGRGAIDAVLARVDETPVWSIVCLFIARPFRSRGVSVALLRSAAQYAGRNDAKIVEGYPVEPKKGRMADAFAFTGLASAFRQAGFVEVLRRSETRPIMRRACRRPAGKRH